MSFFPWLAAPLSSLWQWIPEWWQHRILWTVNGKVTVGVGGVLLNQRDEILLLDHRFHHRYRWGLPGGWLQPGETIFECWRREVREETNLAISIDGLVLHQSTFNGMEFFLAGRIVGGDMRLDGTEILDASFFSHESLPPLYRDHRLAIRRAFAHDGFFRVHRNGDAHTPKGAGSLYA